MASDERPTLSDMIKELVEDEDTDWLRVHVMGGAWVASISVFDRPVEPAAKGDSPESAIRALYDRMMNR